MEHFGQSGRTPEVFNGSDRTERVTAQIERKGKARRWLMAFTLLLCLCFGGIQQAEAIDGKTIVTNGWLIRDVTWNQSAGRVEFKVLFFDNFGSTSKRDEWIEKADLLINNEWVAMLGNECRPTNNANETTMAHLEITPMCDNGKLTVNARNGYSTTCGTWVQNNIYAEMELPFMATRYYTFNVGRVQDGSDYQRHAYAEFYYYPGEMSSNKTIEIKVDNITIKEESSGSTVKYSTAPNGAGVRSVTATMPATPTNQSINGGTIQQGGFIPVSAAADGATSLELWRSSLDQGVSSIEKKSGANVTFTTAKYAKGMIDFFYGVTLYFKIYKAVSGGKTTYVWTGSPSLTSQRTGIFVNNLTVMPSTCGKINLEWQIMNPDVEASYVNTQGFDLQVRKGTGAWTNITQDVPEYVHTKGSTNNYTYTYQLPSGDLNSGEVNYEFRVKRKFADWDDSYFGSGNNNLFYRTATSKLNTNYKGLTGITLNQNSTENNYPRLTWQFTTEGIECTDNIKLQLRIGGTTTELTKAEALSGSYQAKATTAGIQSCTPQRYELILQYGSLAAITYTVNPSFSFDTGGKREFEKIEVSKGYYSDRINVKWFLRDNYDQFSSFRLKRKLLAEAESAYVTLQEFTHIPGGVLQYNYDDNNINAGMYYVYKVEGVYKCNTEMGTLESPTSIGFSQPFGSISGRITYSGNVAVEGVTVNLVTDDAMRANRELNFSNQRTGSYVEIPANNGLLNREGFSVQAWTRSQTFNGLIVNSPWRFSMAAASGGRVQVYLCNNSVDLNIVNSPGSIVAVGAYQHITVTVQPVNTDYKSFEIVIYVNGEKKHTETITLKDVWMTPTNPVHIGNDSRTGKTQAFNGMIDDVRFWNRVLTDKEIELNYNRVLSGKESGLKAYYRFDETDEISNAVFDCSAVGITFNGLHAIKGEGVNRSDVYIEDIKKNHLALRGVTDDQGIYSITNVIPFTSEGTTYTVSPLFGIHEFDPTRRPKFFSPDSKVFNDVDFTDVSSFVVSGVVTYANSNYPVENVLISIDGIAAIKDGKAVMTEPDGTYRVNVPIGSHFITVSKDGHTFVDGGRFPANSNLKHNFQTDMENQIDFTDVTTVRLIGRVAGGQIETDKPLGVGLSKANIGQATVTLKTDNNFRLNLKDQDSSVVSSIGEITSTTIFKSQALGTTVEIKTNPVTGEFVAVLPPVRFNVSGVNTVQWMDDGSPNDPQDFSNSKFEINMDPNSKQTVEYTNASGTQKSFEFNDSLIITRYNEPTITVVDKNAKPGAFGDDVYVYRNAMLNINDTIPLYNVLNDGSINYTLGYPVFSEKKGQYEWEVSGYEEYINLDDPANPVSDKVLLEGTTLKIVNGFASCDAIYAYNEATDEVGEQVSITDAESEIVLDEEGKKVFRFYTGFPNLGDDHLLSMKIILNRDGKSIVWNNNKPTGQLFKGYLLGSINSNGSNFVTKGPDFVDFVLPDPPGSFSSASIEKGSTITVSNSHKFQYEKSEEEETEIKQGLEIGINSGTPFIHFKQETGVIASIGNTIGGKQKSGHGNSTETTLTFNEKVSTSGDPAFVGSDADVYIGRATNRIYGLVRNFSFYPASEDNTNSTIETRGYRLFTKEVMATGAEFSTIFTYQQGFLLRSLIPNTKQLRNGLIQQWNGELPADASGLSFINDEGKSVEVIYLSNKPVTDPDFGENGSYKAYFNPNNKKVVSDEVGAYNTWIAGWQQTISDNEEAKIALNDNREELQKSKMMQNRSFSAGAKLEASVTTTYKDVKMNNSGHIIGGSFTGKSGYHWNELTGFTIQFKVGRENTWEDEDSESNESTVTFSYELSEEGGDYLKGIHDALTVDIYQPVADSMKKIVDGGKLSSPIKTLRGFTFRTRAGQTSCPYEPGDSTLFYEKDNKKQLLNTSTFQIEKPEIYINNAKHATAENIPTGREATFTVQMQNMSEAKVPVTYALTVGDYSNLNGLVLSIDGTPLTAPREYTIEYGQQLVKTLKVKQSSFDILDYDHIELVLASTCDNQELTSSSATLDVTFTPSSSPVTLKSGSTLANRTALIAGGKITFTISDFEPSFRNFGLIRMQYRRANEVNFTTLKEYVNDPALYPITGNREPITGYTINYDFNFEDNSPSDGEYVFRALAVSKIGASEVFSESNEITVIKDVRAPQALGNPMPANGILNLGDEVSITFNENIRNDVFFPTTIKNYFSITGLLNADERAEPTSGLLFDGNAGRANTELPIYAGGSFAIEAWIQMPQYKAGTLFAFGEDLNYISLGLDATGHVVVQIGNESHASTITLEASEVWKYIGMSFNHRDNSVTVYALEEKNNLDMLQGQLYTNVPPLQGKLYVGNNAAGNNGFKGAVSFLHFYNTTRSIVDAGISKNQQKSGNEPGLIGLWELEEGEGAIARDKARSRNLMLNTSWYVFPTGRSLAFNGTSNYATLVSGHFPFRMYDDFSWEFWFKGGNQGAATLLSAGMSASVGFNAAHEMILTYFNAGKDTTLVLTKTNLLDSQWHHFALSVKRGGNAFAMIDGVMANTFNASFFEGAVGGGYYFLAAKMMNTGQNNIYSEFFNGNIDEVRVWSSALTSATILLEKNHKLYGTEAGLQAYYPFDIFTKEDKVMKVLEYLKDMTDPTLTVGNMTATSDVAAPTQDVRPMKDVSFTVTASERKIVLNITEDPYRIEGVTLKISANKILDTQLNPSSAYTWIAYVNQNALKWDTRDVLLAMEQGTAQSFKASVTNRGGENATYYIENIPTWLTVDAPSGSIRPLTAKELTFTVSKAAYIGNYEATIVLRGENNVREILPVTIKITGKRPDWTVNPGDYELWMSVTGQIQIEGAPQEDEDDLLAAFIGDKCVGVASPQYEKAYQGYYTFMSVWGNSGDDQKAITFKYWDASTGQVYPSVDLTLNNSPLNMKFVGDDTYGTPEKPVLFNARNIIEQSIAMGNGWNWIAFNVDNDAPNTLFSQFKTNATFATQVKNGLGNYIYNSGGTWTNLITSMDVKQAYLVKTNQAAALTVIGRPVQSSSTPITLGANKWSWIGYTPQFSLTVAEALAGIANNAAQNDQIKGQTGYRIKTTNGWIGSLAAMEPGRGYMYKSNSAQSITLNYPSVTSMLRSASYAHAQVSTVLSPVTLRSAALELYWETDFYRFANSMTVTASLVHNGEEVQDGLYEIAAFSGDECRGNALLEKIDGFEHPFMGFLMIFGDENDPITLRVYDHATGKEYAAQERFDFRTDAIYGTPDQTYPVTFSGVTGNNAFGSSIGIYPNPVEKLLYINRHNRTLDRLVLTDLTGRIFRIEKDYTGNAIDVSPLAAGMYILKIQDEGRTFVFKFTKK